MFSSETVDLRRDGFWGSHNEKRIFKEVFFGKDTLDPIRSVLGGLVDFECKDSKIADMPFSSNSDSSAVTSQSSSKSSLVENSHVNENSGRGSSSGCFQQRLESDDHIMTTKRMKLSFDGPSITGPHTVKVSTSAVLTGESTTGMPTENGDLGENSMAFYIVESSSQGSVSSCYLSRQHTKLDKKKNVNDGATPKCIVANGDKNAEADKEMGVCRGVSSPVSQESFATRFLLNNPLTTFTEKSGAALAEENLKELDSPGLDASNTSMLDYKKDTRLILQSHAFRILLKMGWHIERRKRACRKYLETIYLSPEGRLFREFPKAWRFCGQILCANGYNLVREEISREWCNFSQFWSDLSDVLVMIEKKTDEADLVNFLAYQWSLLDPFINAVLIGRKIRSLKKGDTVKAVSSFVVGKNAKNDSVMVLTSDDGAINEFADRNLLTSHSNNSLTIQQSSLTVCGGDYHVHIEQSRGRSFSKYDEQTSGVSEGQQFGNVNVLRTSESNSPHQDSSLIDVEIGTCHMDISFVPDELVRTHSLTLESSQKTKLCVEDEQCIQASSFKCKDVIKKKRKSRKISDIKPPSLSQNDVIDMYANQFEVKENLVVSTETSNSCSKVSPTDKFLCRVDRKGLNSKKIHHNLDASKRSQKKSVNCLIDDDDLLVSAIFKNKHCSVGAFKSADKKKALKPRGRPKSKSPKDRCRLLPQDASKVGKYYRAGKWSMMGQRTVLSWLVDKGVIFLNDVIQYRNPKDDSVIKDGLVTKDGIMCRCCSEVLSVSKFKNHAGFKLSRPYLNLFMESGKAFTLCQLQAWSDEYKLRKRRFLVVRTDADDENDDSCGLCGDVGELVCCDNCPSTFHQACLSTEEIPEGSWYCRNCTCWICGELVNDKDASSSFGAFKCSQCEHKYHGTCLKKKPLSEELASDMWFCSESCQEVYTGLNSRVGTSNHFADGYCWILLRCIHEDQKVHSAQKFALKAECNSKLAVALTIMEECFQSMLDPRTGIDMIPHVLYNWGSEFSRLNFHGFYTVVLEKDDVLLSVASIRIHGVTVAEMPLIATCSKYRRQGMCRRLITAIEEMLISLKVEKLVISAIPDLVETWTEGFGFQPVSADEKQSLNKINMMVFPGAVWLKKILYDTNKAQTQLEMGETAPLGEAGKLATESVKQSDRSLSVDDDISNEKEIKLDENHDLEESNIDSARETTDDVKNGQTESGISCGGEATVVSVGSNGDAVKLTAERQGNDLQDQFSKLSCEMLVFELI